MIQEVFIKNITNCCVEWGGSNLGNTQAYHRMVGKVLSFLSHIQRRRPETFGVLNGCYYTRQKVGFAPF